VGEQLIERGTGARRCSVAAIYNGYQYVKEMRAVQLRRPSHARTAANYRCWASEGCPFRAIGQMHLEWSWRRSSLVCLTRAPSTGRPW
jgi:hypothetical protein